MKCRLQHAQSNRRAMHKTTVFAVKIRVDAQTTHSLGAGCDALHWRGAKRIKIRERIDPTSTIVTASIRPIQVSDYDVVSPVIDEWWGGRPVRVLLPRLFF